MTYRPVNFHQKFARFEKQWQPIQRKPHAERAVKLLLIEPSGVSNTGDAGGERTAPNDMWI
jgi:hypothetical protein